MVIYTADLQDSQPNRLYTRLPGVNIKLLFTRQPFQSQFRYIHGSRVYILCHMKSLFTRQSFKSQVGYKHCCRVHTKIVIYTAAVQEPNRLLYIAARCIIKNVIYTAAVQEPIRLNSRLLGIHIQCLITEPNRNGHLDGLQRSCPGTTHISDTISRCFQMP